MEWNTVERAIKTEIDSRTEWKGMGKLGWFMSDINRNIPTTWIWARGDTCTEWISHNQFPREFTQCYACAQRLAAWNLVGLNVDMCIYMSPFFVPPWTQIITVSSSLENLSSAISPTPFRRLWWKSEGVSGEGGSRGESLCSPGRETSSLVCGSLRGTPCLLNILCKYYSAEFVIVAAPR